MQSKRDFGASSGHAYGGGVLTRCWCGYLCRFSPFVRLNVCLVVLLLPFSVLATECAENCDACGACRLGVWEFKALMCAIINQLRVSACAVFMCSCTQFSFWDYTEHGSKWVPARFPWSFPSCLISCCMVWMQSAGVFNGEACTASLWCCHTKPITILLLLVETKQKTLFLGSPIWVRSSRNYFFG